jgi:branched-chain amino acid transport system ATP-binding protein
MPTSDAETPLLEICDVAVHYGGVRALDGARVSLAPGEIVALVGPNGAGKSTVLRAIAGFAPIESGEVRWRGEAFEPVPYRSVERGIAYVPQGRRMLARLTVEENLEIGGYAVKDKKEVRRRLEALIETFPVLHAKRKARAGTLSGGQQQVLAIARGLMVEPEALLLDEPSLGLAPKAVKEVFREIAEINAQRATAIMIVEHNLASLLEIADRAYLLDKGKVVATDTARRLIESDVLERVFMGKVVPA